MTAVFAAGFSWFGLLPGIHDDSLLSAFGVHGGHSHVYVHTCFVVVLLLGFAALARQGLEKARQRQGLERYFADEGLSFRNLAELIAGGITGIMRDVLTTRDTRAFFPIVSAMFLYIFTCNILGIFPGFLPPTDYINTNVGMAVLSFLIFNYVGFSRDAVGYLKHMAGPVLFLAPFLFFVETISLIVRPVALVIRLTGNMFGDHTVFSIMSGFEIPGTGLPIPLLPIPFLMLAMLVSTIQAFVFSLLTVIYIGLSIPHHDDDAEHH